MRVPSFADLMRMSSAITAIAVVATALVFLACTQGRATEASAELTRQHLYAGTLKEGEEELSAKIVADGTDREARFGLGLIRFARAVEHFRPWALSLRTAADR